MILPRALSLSVVAALGCGSAQLDRAFADAAGIPHITSLVVEQRGRVVRERYFGGSGPDTPHDVRSVTKSVVSLLVGIGLDRGCLKSVSETLGESLGKAAPADAAKAAVTFSDLLTMSSGFQWNELGNTAEYNGWVLSADEVAYVLARPLVTTPGQIFSYDSAAFHLLSVALSNGCGATSTFAAQVLFGPLGIGARDWETFSDGYANGAAGLSLTPRDLAALGNLVLDGGRVGSQQVVPAAWVTAATSFHLSTGASLGDGPGYGYGFWIGPGGAFVMAQGYGGQFIFVVPGKQLVVVATADWQGVGAAAADDFQRINDLIASQILPAF